MGYIYLLCMEGYEYTQLFGIFNSNEELYKSYIQLMESDHRCKEDTKTDKPHIYRFPLNSFVGIKQEYGEDWCEYYDDRDHLEVSFDELKEEIHKEIVKKLGFEPKDYKYEERKNRNPWLHDDHTPSKFDGLSLFELKFMRDMNFWRD